jgi:serine/threonine-protein kinase RsbW
MATVEVAFTPLPAHVRTARLVATAVARRSGVDEELLDEVRLAVGEACSRAVEAHRRHCPAEPVRIEMTNLGERFEVIVRDAVGQAGTNGQAGANGQAAGASANGTDGSARPASAAHGGPASAASAGAGSAGAGSASADGAAADDACADSSAPDNADLIPAGFGLAVISGLADDVRISATGSGVSVRMTWPAALGAGALSADRQSADGIITGVRPSISGYRLLSLELRLGLGIVRNSPGLLVGGVRA